jgi:hypothetical protein
MRPSYTFLGNIRWGVGLGLVFATLYSLYVAILFLIVGTAPFDKHHTTVLTVIAAYFAGGITGGAVVGAMRPYTDSRFTAILVGIVVAFFVVFGVLVASHGLPWRWDQAAWASLVITSMLLGSFGGNWFWKHQF